MINAIYYGEQGNYFRFKRREGVRFKQPMLVCGNKILRS